MNEMQKTIVLVDDEGLVLMGLEEVLLMEDYLVKSFMFPEEAVVYCEAYPGRVGLLATDQSMPGINGVDLIRRFHQINPDVPAILFTGHMDMDEESLKHQHGLVKVLIKPFDPDLFLETVSELIEMQ